MSKGKKVAPQAGKEPQWESGPAPLLTRRPNGPPPLQEHRLTKSSGSRTLVAKTNEDDPLSFIIGVVKKGRGDPVPHVSEIDSFILFHFGPGSKFLLPCGPRGPGDNALVLHRLPSVEKVLPNGLMAHLKERFNEG